jgi:diguanylate cyclase (GGDEF)-like protein
VTQSAVLQDALARPVIDVTEIRAAGAGPGPAPMPNSQRMFRLWLMWLGGAVLFCAGQLLAGAGGPVGGLMSLAMPVLFTGGIVAGVLLNKPQLRWPWFMLASAGVVTVVGYGLWWGGVTTVAFTVFMVVYPLEAAALLLIVRGASWRRDRAGLLDTAMICVGLALAYWLLVITPLMRVHSTDENAVFVVLFPLGDVLLLGVLIRFFTSKGLRNAAFWQISASLLLQTVSHMASVLATVLGVGLPSFQIAGTLAGFLMAGAAVHPSMRLLTAQPLRPVAEMSPVRVLLVNLACMGAPALLIAQGILQHGQVGWIAAGIGCIVLFALVALRMVDLVGQVQDKARQLDAVAHIDALTALPNRRAWDLELSRRIASARRHGSPVVVAILDLDLFKRFNDEHGHQGGDELLSSAAEAWRAELRPEDLLARYGGEEFGAIFDHSRLADADRIIERLQAVTPLGQTFSAGAALWNGSESAEELLARADAALYAAKRAGRDRVYISSNV